MNSNAFQQKFRLISLKSRRFRLPLAQPLRTAIGIFQRREIIVVEAWIRIDGEDYRGHGEASPLKGWCQLSAAEVCQRIATTGLEKRELTLTTLNQLLDGAHGKDPLVRHGISMAIAAALARSAGQTLARMLACVRGVYPQREVPVQQTLGAADPELTCAGIRQAQQQGFTTVKLKVGSAPLQQDIERIRRVANDFPGMEIRLDANAAWTLDEALQALIAMPVALIEQPVSRAELIQLLRLRPGPWPLIGADESCADPDSARALIEDGTIDALIVKPCTLGSPIDIFKLLEQARDRGIDIIFSNLMESAIGRFGAIALAASWPEFSGPHGLATAHWFASDLGSAEPVRNARIEVAQSTGIVCPTLTENLQ